MKTAIKVPAKLRLRDTELNQIIEFLPNPEKWTFGNVDVFHEYFIKVKDNPLSKYAEGAISRLNFEFKLNAINKSFAIRGLNRKFPPMEPKPALAFGRGTVGSHTDSMSGVCLLTLLYVFPFNSDESPEHLGHDGEFHQGKFFQLSVGESVIFNDDAEHAWLCNGCWVFSLFPLVSKRG